jgi:hypothetical protein
MLILFKLLPFILLYSFIEATAILKNKDNVSLVYYEYSYNISEINLEMKNRNVKLENSVQCRLAFIEDESKDHEEIFEIYSNYINRQWIFFTNSNETARKLLKIDYFSKNIFLLGLFVPKSLNFKIDEDYQIPIFEINDTYTEMMKACDIRYAKKNIFFTLEVKHAIEYYPENYFLILSMTILICTFSFLIYWKISVNKIAPENILPIQRICQVLIYFNAILSIILVVKSFNIRGTKIYESEEESSILIETAFVTLNSLFRALLWLLAFLLSFGYNISLQRINGRDCKTFLKATFLMFILLSIDQVLDLILSPIYRIHLSEIKNLIFYGIIIFVMCKKLKKNITFLQMKIHYASLISPEYLGSLKYKLKLIKSLRIIYISYIILFLIIIALEKTIFYTYDELTLESYNYMALDAVFLYSIIILFRPKELPEFYNINLGDDLDVDEGNVYKYKLPKYSEANSLILKLTKKEIESCKKGDTPILIIGPNNDSDLNNNSEGIIEINNNDNSINKYFLSISLGFANNSK